MTQETSCPACGAPLEITGQNDIVRCTFCGAELSVESDGGGAAFRVVHQPEPQKETLSKPVEGHGEPTGAAQIYAEAGMGGVGSTIDEPLRSASQFDIPAPTFQPEVVSSGATVYPANPPQRTGLSGANRWWIIGGAVLLGLFLLCVCVVIAAVTLFPALGI